MTRSLEDIVGQIGKDRQLPGTNPEGADEVRYVSFERPAGPSDLFEDVVWKVDPPMVSNGGVSLANFLVTIPDGTPFYALEYHGDVSGWKMQIERGAQESGVLSAKIEAERFVISDGRTYSLSECVVDYTPGLSNPS